MLGVWCSGCRRGVRRGLRGGNTGKVVSLGQAIAIGEAELLREITAEPAEEARVKLLMAALERAVDPVLQSRFVT